MKAEDTPSQTPTTTFSAAQWGPQSQIPIDPALQQQQPTPHPTPTYTHYQYQHYAAQAGYSHYQYPPPQQPQQPPQQQQQAYVPHAQPPSGAATMAVAPQPARQNIQPMQTTTITSTLDTADVATLNDALGSAGVDLRAEEETLHRTFDTYQAYRPYEDRSRKQPPRPNFDARIVGGTMRDIGNKHKVTKIPEDSVNYVALAARARLQDLVTAMIEASAHRTNTQFDRAPSTYEDGSPMWGLVIRSDVGKQLAALEKIEKEEEMKVRRERREREEAAAAQTAALQAQQAASGSAMVVDGEEDGQPKKKKKKEGPGVTARNMSEDVRKKMSNAVASQAAGLGTGKYAWMTAASATVAPPKPKPVTSTGSSGLSPATTTAPAVGAGGAGGWARPYVSSKPSTQQMTPPKEEDGRRLITLRDALFVIEKERGHGGGKGSARGWT